MKSVLMSIQPYWLFLIIAKKMGWNIKQHKTIEVRKNYPKNKYWNKIVKLYCSKDKKSFNRIPKEFQPLMKQFLGKVIGEFVCNDIEPYTSNCTVFESVLLPSPNDLAKMCLTLEELNDYGTRGKLLYGWHISDLVIYDKPKELHKFYKCGFSTMEELEEELCGYCSPTNYGEVSSCVTPNGYVSCEGRYCNEAYQKYLDDNFFLTRPPQSWCYVESIESE